MICATRAVAGGRLLVWRMGFRIVSWPVGSCSGGRAGTGGGIDGRFGRPVDANAEWYEGGCGNPEVAEDGELANAGGSPADVD